MDVVLLDDQQQSIDYCRRILKQIADENQEALRIIEYTSGLSLAADAQVMGSDLMFIDIGLKDEDGIEVACSLREAGYDGDIVFFTRKRNRAIDAFDAGALHYILKAQDCRERIEKVFLKALVNYRRKNTNVIILQNSTGARKIDVSSILYFEVNKRIITVYYGNQSFEFYSTLGKIEYMMGGTDFIRCHKSYLVSKNAVKEVIKEPGRLTLSLIDASQIPVGRTYAAQVREVFLKPGEVSGKGVKE